MGFGGIDKPINNSQIGVPLGDLKDPDIHYHLKCLIKNVLEAIVFSPLPKDSVIESAIESSLKEYASQMRVPPYMPQRKYLATPLCPKCSSQMELSINDAGELVYTCMARNCKYTNLAEIN